MPIREVRKKVEDSFLLIDTITENFSKKVSKIINEYNNIIITSKIEKRIKDSILSTADNLLTATPLISGVGFVTYNEDISHSWKVAWLYRPDGLRIPNRICLNKASQSLLDYPTFLWFNKVKAFAKGYLHGPYVDYICNANYTLTYLYPVYLDQQLVGIAATDIRVAQIEQIIRETLASHRTALVISTLDGRILFSNHDQYRVGELGLYLPTAPQLSSRYFSFWDVSDH